MPEAGQRDLCCRAGTADALIALEHDNGDPALRQRHGGSQAVDSGADHVCGAQGHGGWMRDGGVPRVSEASKQLFCSLRFGQQRDSRGTTMDVGSDEKNTRLPLLDPAALNPDQRELYERMQASMLPWARKAGFDAESADDRLLGPFNAFLYSPELGAAQLNYLKTEQDATCLDARVREVVILTVGAVFESGYELYAHRAVAASSGLAPEDIEALATGKDPGAETKLHPRELTAQRFVRAIAAEHRATPELYREAFHAFGHKGLVDMLHLAGLYMTVSSLLNAFEVPVPE